MGNYYFLSSSLPPLKPGEKCDLSFEEFIFRAEMNLKGRDLEKMRAFRTYIDLNNIRFLLLEEEIDHRGNLTEKELDESIVLKEGLPVYVFDFLDEYSSVSEKLRHFSGIFSLFLRKCAEESEGFLKRYFQFEREWKLVMLAIKSKELKRDLVKELQFEDLTDSFVMQMLAQRDSESYDPPEEYRELKERYLSCGLDPWEQYKTINTWRFEKIGELVEDKPLFSIDAILSYMAQLWIVEDWNNLSESKGAMILDAFVSPSEFKS